MATMTITAGSTTLSFLTAQAVEGGFLYATPEIVEERLTTPGVSGTRWRTVFSQFPMATIATSAEASSYPSAIALAASYLSLVGTLVSVSWTTAGTPTIYRNAHVAKVEPQPVAGQPVGGGANTGSFAHVRALWTLEATDFPAGTSA